MPDFSDPAFRNAFLAASAMAVSCAVLSVFVVARRWAFMGEGISHSGFGGAGTAWILAVLFPSVFDGELMPYVFVILFCLLAALTIGWLSSGQRVTSDAAIGIFLVASLAWGFVGQHVYYTAKQKMPVGFENLLFGQMSTIDTPYAVASVLIAAAVIGAAWLMGKELIAYCFDPLLARTSGVSTTFIHYLLMLLLAAVIVIGTRVVGSVLVTALLVLPAATANLLSRRIDRVVVLSIVVAVLGAWGGLLANLHWRALPAGSMIVLVMFVLFVAALAWSRLRGTRA